MDEIDNLMPYKQMRFYSVVLKFGELLINKYKYISKISRGCEDVSPVNITNSC